MEFGKKKKQKKKPKTSYESGLDIMIFRIRYPRFTGLQYARVYVGYFLITGLDWTVVQIDGDVSNVVLSYTRVRGDGHKKKMY